METRCHFDTIFAIVNFVAKGFVASFIEVRRDVRSRLLGFEAQNLIRRPVVARGVWARLWALKSFTTTGTLRRASGKMFKI